MPIKFPVGPGTILLCDYNTGFQAPEMVKRRPVVAISPRLPYRDGLCTIVPLSTTPPPREVAYCCRIELAEALPQPFGADPIMWAKADMVATVAFRRLDLFQTARDQTGRRRYLHPKVTDQQLWQIRRAVMHAIGAGDLTS